MKTLKLTNNELWLLLNALELSIKNTNETKVKGEMQILWMTIHKLIDEGDDL